MSTFVNGLGENGNKSVLCANCEKTYKSRSGLWKHLKNCIAPILESNAPIIDNPICETTTSNNQQQFTCNNCPKQYKERSGLWRHKQKCKPSDNSSKNDLSFDSNNHLKETIIDLLKQNNELQMQLIKIAKEHAGVSLW